jgi:hypothetical protein
VTLVEGFLVIEVVSAMNEEVVFAGIRNVVIANHPLPQQVTTKDELQLARYGIRIIMVKRAARHEANPHFVHLSPPSECDKSP